MTSTKLPIAVGVLGAATINTPAKDATLVVNNTGAVNAETSVQKAIVSAALSAIGQASGASRATGGKWLSDTSGGDGKNFYSAFDAYKKWVSSKDVNKKTLEAIKLEMKAALAGSAYHPVQKDAVVERIINRFGTSQTVAADTEQAMLDYLGVQKQCLEWASSTGLAAGGSSRGYSDSSVAKESDYRPGMLVVWGRQHAAIIVAINKTKNGELTYDVAESNWGVGWKNPSGQTPWERTIRKTLNLKFTDQRGLGASPKVISFG